MSAMLLAVRVVALGFIAGVLIFQHVALSELQRRVDACHTPPSPPLTIAPCDLGNCVVPNPDIASPPAMDLEGEGDHATIICATPKLPGVPLCEDHST